MKNRTSSYIMTIDPLSTTDMEKLNVLRQSTKHINAIKRTTFYIKCQGRGPRTAAAKLDGVSNDRYFQSLPLRHAKTMDVYIYER